MSINLNSYTPGIWYYYSNSFDLRLNRTQDNGNRWFSVQGTTFGSSNSHRYTYIDDVSLHRPCDIDSACWPGTGQICPQVITAPSPQTPLELRGIGNATSMHVRLFVPGTGSNVWDTTYVNRNGLPDVKIPAQLLATRLASRQYDAEITLGNACGAFQTSAVFDILNGIYDTLDTWADTTWNWTRTPVPCCLSTLTLEDMEIVGDVSFQVRDSIIVRDGVSAGAGSNILLLARDVLLLDSVLFDGAVSDVTITEAPCINRMADPNQLNTGNSPRPLKLEKPQGEPDQPFGSQAPESIASTSDDPFEVMLSPNPFDEKLLVGIEVFKPGQGSVTMYNAQMVAVRRIIEENLISNGDHLYTVPTADLASGLYFLRVEVGDFVITEKVIKR